jgi:triacylglycerol esterase/lipase EstA (alpha/beta hydrolase family)
MNRYIGAVVVFAALAFQAADSFAQTDTAREARWRAEVEPNIVVGDAQTLVSSDGREFFSIFIDGKQSAVAFVLVHGAGTHPDFGAIGKLRMLLADAGHASLSIQMPVLAAEGATPEKYQLTFPDAARRMTAAHAWLRQRGHQRIVLIAHSMGAWMSNVYFQQTPRSPYSAWVAIGVTGRITSMGENKLPILDIYAERDFDSNLRSAWMRRTYLWLFPGSRQTVIANTDHYFVGAEAKLAEEILNFVQSLPTAARG